MLLGKILKHIRVFNHQTQIELAERLSLSRSYISEIEASKKIPTMEVLQNYSSTFDIPLSSILLFAEEYDHRNKLKKKMRGFLTRTAINFLDWICKEDEKQA
jgi:transcriptional regulator with XRE-family HTH domain